MAGRPPKPTRLKIIEGNPGKRPLNVNEPEPEHGIPPMPDWLKAFPVAVKEWERESEILDGMGIMTYADAPNLAHRVYLESLLQEIADRIRKEGMTYDIVRMDAMGNEIIQHNSHPLLAKFKELTAEYRQIGSLLGLDAGSRSKMSVDPDWKRKRKFGGLIGGQNNQH